VIAMRTASAVLIALGLVAAPAAQPARFQLDDLGRVVRVSDPQIAPDGRSIVVVVARANYDENRWDANLVSVDVAGGATHALTQDRRGVAMPRFSPKGDRLAFLSSTAVAAGQQPHPQIFVMPLAGGDAKRVTAAPKGVQQFAWSPDGSTFAFVTEDEPEAKKGPERFNDSFEVENDDVFVQAAAMPSHIWTVPSNGGDATRRTSGRWSLPVAWPPGPPASPVTWSPDGSSLLFVRAASPHSGDASQTSAQILELASGQIRNVTSNEHGGETHPIFSPDGASVAYAQPRDLDPGNITDVHVAATRGGGAGRNVTRALDRNMARAIWAADGTSLLVGANDGTRVSLWIQPVEGVAKKLNLGTASPNSSFWVDVAMDRRGAIAFTGTDTLRPAEVYYMASADAAPKRLTDFNAEIAGRALGRTEVVSWQTGGFAHNGTLTFPPDFDQSRRYPLVLVIHGGPRAASLETFSPQAQLMAAKGWIVFQPNYRGSDQLGNTYEHAIVNDAGAGPGRDVMAGLELVKKRAYVDTARVAVSGWSYGGYMTTWLLGNYGGWRVAVAGASVTDWLDQYNFGDANVRRANAFGGSPWTDPRRLQAYVEQSPITYAAKIRTPTLVMCNTQDYRVPPTQSYKLYHALRDNGVPTKFVAYPIYGHNATDPVRQRDVQRRWVEWIEQYFRAAPDSQ